MPRKSGEKRNGQERRAAQRGGPGANRRGIKRNEETSQLLERGEGPTAEEQVDPAVDSPSEVTNEGGPGADASDRYGGRLSEPSKADNRGMRGTGGEGGYGTLGGGVYPDEGRPEDTPNHGDWQRHSTGGTSGARGQEGFGYPGEQTWGEEQFAAERRQEQGRSRRGGGPRAQRRSDESLANEIREILTNDPELDATDVEVKVEDGAVTISGLVDGSDWWNLSPECARYTTS